MKVNWKVVYEPREADALRPVLPAPDPGQVAKAHLADSTDKDVWRCMGCLNDFYFASGGRPERCPVCDKGSWVRRFLRVGASGPPAYMEVHFKVLGTDGIVREERVVRLKLGRDGQRAEEMLSFNHRSPDKTVKRHTVDRVEPQSAKWDRVHDEAAEFPAKRRVRPKEGRQ